MRAALCLLLCACAPSAQRLVQFPADAIGDERGSFSAGAWTVTLARADVAFGPVSFCAGHSASEAQCPAAQAELLSATAFDALSATPHALGSVSGLSGAIRSASFDYGISWFSVETAAAPRTALGHSAVFDGRAVKGDTTLVFHAAIDVTPLARGTHAVLLPRTTAQIDGADLHLRIRFSPQQWWAVVDFDALAAKASAGEVSVDPGSDEASLLIIQMTANAPPVLRWSAQ